MINRHLGEKIKTLSRKFPVVTVTGPRQSGKTTLVKALFPQLPYVSLEDPDVRLLALGDPRGFLSNFSRGAVLDEVQRTPELFSYLQTIVDREREVRFILSGSSNFLLMEKISQSLAGRSAVLHLLPFSMQELADGGHTFDRPEAAIFAGQYPPVFDRDIPPTDFFPAYIQTYVERDVRLLKDISDLNAFIQFTRLCAGRTGQLLNYADLASNASISPHTAKAWLSVLEASYIVYRLQPYHKNFNKRLIKSPKLYFYDTGLACSLLGIRSAAQVATHYLRGGLFENLIINEIVKHYFNAGERRYPYFWRNKTGKEIDCLLEQGETVVPVEIKAGQTMTPRYFDGLKYWRELVGESDAAGYVVYGGDGIWQLAEGTLVGWRDLPQVMSKLVG